MTSAKRTADQPEDLDVGGAVAEVSGKKVSARLTANSTFASRAKAGKRVGAASNKAVTAEESKAK